METDRRSKGEVAAVGVRKGPAMRRAFISALTGLLFLLPSGCAREPRADPQRTPAAPLVLARYYWPGQFWIDIAAQKGWFAEEGLNVRLVDANADYYGSLQATISGDVDANGFYLFDLMKFNAQGADLVGFFSSDVDLGASGIALNPQIGRLNGLRGKKVAVESGTFYDYLLALALAREGLTLDDVERIELNGERALESYRRPDIAAVVTWEPRLSELVALGAIRAFDTRDLPGAGAGVFAARRKVIQERQAELAALTRVWWRTTRFIRSNPEAAYAIIARLYGKSLDEVREFAARDAIRDLRDNDTAFVYSPAFESLHGLGASVNRYFVEESIVRQPLDTTRLLDARFLRMLKQDNTVR